MFFLQNDRILMDIDFSKPYLGIRDIINNPQGQRTCRILTFQTLA